MVNDPYETLGVRRGASQEEIKSAYRELVKKYHPDKYQGNPLADLAQEKLQEVNEAYDMLTNGNGASGYGGFQQEHWNSYGQYQSSQSGSATGGSAGYTGENAALYQQVRACIMQGQLAQAKSMLLNLSNHDAEWFFLSGVIAFNQGAMQEGVANVKQAMDMAPGNDEYRQAYLQMSQVGTFYRGRSDARGYQPNQSAADMLPCMFFPICFPCYC